MKTKILYTNGARTIELFWVKHTGTDVYCGLPKNPLKRSYHASGKLHTRSGDEEHDSNWVAPLMDLKGAFHLMTIGISNSPDFVENARPELNFSGGKVDAAIYLDARSIPAKTSVAVLIGLLEPGNADALRFLTIIPNARQVLLSTLVAPWVSATVTWSQS